MVLRSQCLEAEAARAPSQHGSPGPGQAAPLTATDWCAAADDWGDEEEGEWGDGDENSECLVEETTAGTEAKGKLIGTVWNKVISGASCVELPSSPICLYSYTTSETMHTVYMVNV